MSKMAPWVEVFWNSLNEGEQKELSKISRIICQTASIDSARNACYEKIVELCKRYNQIAHHCDAIISNRDFMQTSLIPCSDIQFITTYFGQFKDAYPNELEDWAQEKSNNHQNNTTGRRRFLVRNGYHGDIIVELVRETTGSYYFDYIKDGDVVFENWRVLKNSGRVIKEIWD